jgi:hypothetical protein
MNALFAARLIEAQDLRSQKHVEFGWYASLSRDGDVQRADLVRGNPCNEIRRSTTHLSPLNLLTFGETGAGIEDHRRTCSDATLYLG